MCDDSPVEAKAPADAKGARDLAAGAAEAFGTAIAINLRGIFTSPLVRCRETAASICAGARVEILAVDDRHLGDPGVFVGDAGLAWTNWQDLGHASVVDHLA